LVTISSMMMTLLITKPSIMIYRSSQVKWWYRTNALIYPSIYLYPIMILYRSIHHIYPTVYPYIICPFIHLSTSLFSIISINQLINLFVHLSAINLIDLSINSSYTSIYTASKHLVEGIFPIKKIFPDFGGIPHDLVGTC